MYIFSLTYGRKLMTEWSEPKLKILNIVFRAGRLRLFYRMLLIE